MIKRKMKMCESCKKERYIFSKKMCLFCFQKNAPQKSFSKNQKPIPKRSKKGQKEDRLYYKLAKKFKEDNPYCKARLDGCTNLTADVHHMKSRGVNLNKVEYWLPLCRSCHNKITVDSAFAIREGFSYSRLTK